MASEHIGTVVERVMDIAAKRQAQPLILTLTEPPSANRWWRKHGTTIHLSNEARDYKAMAARVAGVNGATLFPTEFLTVTMVWHRSKKSGDLDKRLGILLDGLQERKQQGLPPLPGVYASDAQIVMLWARRVDKHPEIPKGFVRVEICPTTVEA